MRGNAHGLDYRSETDMDWTIEVRQAWTLRGRKDTITSDTWHGM